ncbi:MAG: Sec-independent protein translocase protein TatB [Brevundimonas sp.]|uniref:Sec-independent protein translocase protein TatB n=1 Tax=Brevundimonas sp. TaxID=1871086 RepID=UPI0025B9FB0D|nr:Sec-independent protein translocase protein TatB [Brevundimonas sp.]MBX3476002.1 Sec-independent protein translocase protein TatB [Brevundimonas sp.]
MGGLGPGVGGFEILVIGLIALIVVGPKDLPVLMKRVGQFMAKMRAMANEFRASFDEMARQSELDELRKEVAALKSGQGMYALGAEAEEAFRDINKDLSQPLVTGRSEWPDAEPVMPALPTPAVDAPIPPVAVPAKAKRARKPAAKAEAKASAPKGAKARATAKAPAKAGSKAKTGPRRTKAADQ